MNPNPFVELNYAIALYFAGDGPKAFLLLEELLQQPFLNQYYLLNAAIGKLYLLEGDMDKASVYLNKTLGQTSNPAEIAFIQGLLSATR